MIKDRLTILVIDDNPADAGLLRRLLGKIGEFQVEVVHCLNEADGKEALSAKDFDCLFLDYQLGESSGLDVLDSIRALGHDLPVIMLTGAGDESVAIEAMKRGAQEYLVKDVMVRNVMTPDGIHLAITNTIEKVSLERQITQTIKDLGEAKSVSEKQAEDLAIANAELEQLAHAASHDLKEPVRNLVSYSTLLREDLGEDLSDDVAMDLEYITGAANRMGKLVDGLLSLSRASRSSMKREPVLIENCVTKSLEALRTRVLESGSHVEWDTLPEVTGDSFLLTQLYQNLLANAMKFTESGSPVIRLTAEQTGDVWTLGVRDNGIGISPEYSDQIFAPFKRLHGMTEFEGTGIGLALCRKTVERHGGKIWVESEPGKGAHFKFTLPAAKGDQS